MTIIESSTGHVERALHIPPLSEHDDVHPDDVPLIQAVRAVIDEINNDLHEHQRRLEANNHGVS